MKSISKYLDLLHATTNGDSLTDSPSLPVSRAETSDTQGTWDLAVQKEKDPSVKKMIQRISLLNENAQEQQPRNGGEYAGGMEAKFAGIING